MASTIAELAQACREQAKNKTSTNDPCYELFRHGFEHGNEAAWEALHAQYHALICRWIQRKGYGRFDHETTSDLADEAFAKFWRTLQNSDVTISERFATTSQLIGYLNRCAVSTVHDQQRKQQRQTTRITTLDEARQASQQAGLAEQIDNQNLLARIRQWIAQEVKDPQEKLILSGMYEAGLTPREIAAQHADVFPDVRTVRRVQERVLKRMRRSLLSKKVGEQR